jgi:hypothetical protein
MRHTALSATLALTLAASAAAVPPVPFTDGDFPDAEWTTVTSSFEVYSVTPLPGGSTTSARQDPTGNDAFRAITHVVPAAPSPTAAAAVWSAHFRNGATYDPSVQGAIGSIDYAEDARRLSGLGQSAGLAIRQGSQVFVVQVGATPESVFTRQERKAIKAADFGVLTAGGFPGGAKPVFSSAGGLIELGFVRGNSTSVGGVGYTITAAIDNWSVQVNPPCTLPTECDDADPCTTDTCDAGACAFTPVVCDDGDGCTVDACAAGVCQFTARDCDDGVDCTADACVLGACQNTLAGTHALVDAKIQQLQDILAGLACADDTLTKKFGKKLTKKLKKARARLTRADDATKDPLIDRLFDKADVLLGVADSILSSALANGLVTPACGQELQGFLAEIRQCVSGIPH